MGFEEEKCADGHALAADILADDVQGDVDIMGGACVIGGVVVNV